jgi:hypothetical protein
VRRDAGDAIAAVALREQRASLAHGRTLGAGA